jgi:hypothetical protein
MRRAKEPSERVKIVGAVSEPKRYVGFKNLLRGVESPDGFRGAFDFFLGFGLLAASVVITWYQPVVPPGLGDVKIGKMQGWRRGRFASHNLRKHNFLASVRRKLLRKPAVIELPVSSSCCFARG